MRSTVLVLAAAAVSLSLAGPLAAATPASEQAFLTAFKTAFQAKDANAIKALVHTDGVSPMMLDFYMTALTSDFADGANATFALQNLTPDDVAEVGRTQPGPGGGLVKLSPTPYKKLVITVAVKNSNGSSTTTSSVYVADEGDKIRISAPADVK